jgi:elongation of very long chain fatty acids protein 7
VSFIEKKLKKILKNINFYLLKAKMDAHLAVINSLVHIVMYSYYFASSFKEVSRKIGFVKPFITGMQLIQLVVILGQVLRALISCNNSKLFILQAINAGILIFFFAQFYVQSYLKKKQK